jgi:serpin B
VRSDALASMIVIKPEGDLDAFVQNLTAARWQELVDALYNAEPALGRLSMPKLKLEFKAELNNPLIAMGMPRAFTNAAQFGDLLEGDTPLEISQVIQKTFLNVDEKGTEAAAVTSVGIRATSMPMYAFEMQVDRPYFFAIRDNRSGAILFAGAIQMPEGGEIPVR